MAGPDANINELVRMFYRAQGYGNPNTFSYQKAKLTLHDVDWYDTTPGPTHQGLTRSVAVEDATGSSGNVSVTLNQAVITVRVHLTAGRFASGDKKAVKLHLPSHPVFENFDSMEFDASKEKSDATQKSVPVKVVDETLSSFKNVSVTSNTTMFEGTFRSNAVLTGIIVTNFGQIHISNIVDHFDRNLPTPFSVRNGNSLSWPVHGIAEFVLDSQSRVR